MLSSLFNTLAKPFVAGMKYIDARPSGGQIRTTLEVLQAAQVNNTVALVTPGGAVVQHLEGTLDAASVQAGMNFAKGLTRSTCKAACKQAKAEILAVKKAQQVLQRQSAEQLEALSQLPAPIVAPAGCDA